MKMLSQFKMNPDPAYQNRLLPERDNASFFDGYSVWFYKEQGDLQQANAFTLEFEIAPFGISSEGDAIFSCMDRKTSEGMAVRLTSDGKVVIKSFTVWPFSEDKMAKTSDFHRKRCR